MVKYSQLNDNQKLAVVDNSKHIRVVAGAGSGKTRVLTMRIAYLIEQQNVKPYNILGITFTNKAAKEMKSRILEMLEDKGSGTTISTIHSLCMRILMQDIDKLGYPKNFSICDSADQKQILKEAYKQLGVDKNEISYSSALDYIGNNKYEFISPTKALDFAYGDYMITKKAKIYKYYEDRLKETYSLDFDDLILFTLKLFEQYPTCLQYWSNKYHYVLVDEFQDIDLSQYKLIKYLSSVHDNLYVVGDPDQTIYTWRGANVNIIMNFDKDFKDSKTIYLNENYRSTNNILNGANSVISNNKNRLKKDLYSKNGDGSKIIHKSLDSDEDEAYYVAREIEKLHNDGTNYNDIAVLYRSNYLSRNIEKALMEKRIPYIIYGGLRFYEREEVKDILSYLRLIVSNNDLAFIRVINKPRRGIGETTVNNILNMAKANNLTMYEVIKKGLYPKNKSTFDKFVSMVEKWRNDLTILPLEKLFEEVLTDSGYREMLEKDNETERLENIKTLIDDIKEYEETYPDSSLDEYLMMISLYTDKASEEERKESVSLMTIHSAKGLEFENVFVIALCEGVFPSNKSMQEGSSGVEEERRLAYVAYTRAKKKLYLSDTNDYSYVLSSNKMASRFIKEIDEEYIEHLNEIKPTFTSKIFSDEDTGFDKDEAISFGEDYNNGDLVVSTVFGDGVVIDSNNGILTIAFSHPHGIKKILASHPSISKKIS